MREKSSTQEEKEAQAYELGYCEGYRDGSKDG
jgi:hypothetical protein